MYLVKALSATPPIASRKAYGENISFQYAPIAIPTHKSAIFIAKSCQNVTVYDGRMILFIVL